MAVYCLVAEAGAGEGAAVPVDIVLVEPQAGRTLTLEEVKVTGQDDRDVKQAACRGAWISYAELRDRRVVHPASEIPRSGVTFDFAGATANHISGPSAGLCFLVKMAVAIIEDFLTRNGRVVPSLDFAATGVLSHALADELVGEVQSIEAKINAALGVVRSGGCVFFPRANDEQLDPSLHQRAEQGGARLVAVETARDAIDVLAEVYGLSEHDGPTGGWPWKVPRWCPPAALAVLLAFAAFHFMRAGEPDTRHTGDTPTVGAELTTRRPTGARAYPVPVEAGLYYEAERGEAKPLLEGETLQTGDGYRIRLDVRAGGFIYVLLLDSKHHLVQLFPSACSAVQVRQGTYWLPRADRWVELDDVRGQEEVLVFASSERSNWLEDKCDRRIPVLREGEERAAVDSGELSSEVRAYFEHEQSAGRATFVRRVFQHE